MARKITLGIIALVCILPAPFVSGWGELVGGQRAGTRRKRAGYDDGLLAVPGRVVHHYAGVGADILRGQLGQFVGLGVDPAEWLHVF